MFYRRGLIETWGRATLKISGLMQQAGLPEPTMQEHGGSVTLIFALPERMAAQTAGGGDTLGKTLGKTPEIILRYLIAAPDASIPELAQILDKSESAIERAIRKLRADGKLRRIGPAKGGHWEVLE